MPKIELLVYCFYLGKSQANTLDMLQRDQFNMEVVMSFGKAFKIVAANLLLQLCEPGISICKLASQVNKALQEDSACTEEFGRLLWDKFYNLLNTQFLSTSLKGIMHSFHALCTEEEYVKERVNIILSVDLIPSNTSYSLFNYIMQEVLNKVLKLGNSKILPGKKDLNIALDQSGQETLRCVAIESDERLVLNKNVLVNYCGENVRSVILQKLTISEKIDSK